MTDHARVDHREASACAPAGTSGDIAADDRELPNRSPLRRPMPRLPIATAIVEALRAANILLPMPSTIERAGIAGRARSVRKQCRAPDGRRPERRRRSVMPRCAVRRTGRTARGSSWLKTIPVATKDRQRA